MHYLQVRTVIFPGYQSVDTNKHTTSLSLLKDIKPTTGTLLALRYFLAYLKRKESWRLAQYHSIFLNLIRMSDSDSSLSIVPRPLSRKRHVESITLDDSSEDEAFVFTKRNFSPRHKAGKITEVAVEDSDSDDSVLNQLKTSKEKSSKKSNTFSIDDSDSDNDADIQTSLTSKPTDPPITKPAISLDSDSDDDDGDFQVVESDVMRKARLAREALENEPVDLLGDGDDDDDDDAGNCEIPVEPIMPVRTVSKPAAPDPPATGPIIRIHFRANVKSAPSNHGGKDLHGKTIVLSFRTGTKWEAVLKHYRERVNPAISSLATVNFMFDGLNMAMNKTIAQCDLEDEDLVDVSITIPANAPQGATAAIETPKDMSSTNVTYVQIKTRIKGGDPRKVHTFHLNEAEPFEKLLKSYRQMHGYSSLKRVLLETTHFQIEPTLCPNDLGLEGTCDLFICDEQQRVKQVQRMPNSKPSGSSTTQMAGSSGGLEIKIRLNGSDKDVSSFSILPSETFQKLMEYVCQKFNVKNSDCKYIFDGVPLNANYTPNDEDLEGGEVIDVQINKDALEKGSKALSSSMPSAQAQSNPSGPLQQLSIGCTRKVIAEGSLGVTICGIDGFIRVRSVDSDKMKGRLFPGDKITYANGKEISGTTTKGFAKLLQSIGNRRELTVLFLGGKGYEEVVAATKPKSSSAAVSVASNQSQNPKSSSIGPKLLTKTIIPVFVIRNNVSSSTALSRKDKLIDCSWILLNLLLFRT